MKILGRQIPWNSTFYPVLLDLSEDERETMLKRIDKVQSRKSDWKQAYNQESHYRSFNPYLFAESKRIVDDIEAICEGASLVRTQGFRGLANYPNMVKSWDKVSENSLEMIANNIRNRESTSPSQMVRKFWSRFEKNVKEASIATETVDGDMKRLKVMSLLARYTRLAYQLQLIDNCPLYYKQPDYKGNRKNINEVTTRQKSRRINVSQPALEYDKFPRSAKDNLTSLADFDVKTYLSLSDKMFAYAVYNRLRNIRDTFSQDSRLEAYIILLIKHTDIMDVSCQPVETVPINECLDKIDIQKIMSGEQDILNMTIFDFDEQPDTVYIDELGVLKGDYGMGIIPVISQDGHSVNCGFDRVVGFASCEYEIKDFTRDMDLDSLIAMIYPSLISDKESRRSYLMYRENVETVLTRQPSIR